MTASDMPSWRWTWQHSMILCFFAILVNGCVCGLVYGAYAAGERVSTALETDPSADNVDAPTTRTAADDRPLVSMPDKGATAEGGDAMFRKDEIDTSGDKVALRAAEAAGEISWTTDDIVRVPNTRPNGRVARAMKKGLRK